MGEPTWDMNQMIGRDMNAATALAHGCLLTACMGLCAECYSQSTLLRQKTVTTCIQKLALSTLGQNQVCMLVRCKLMHNMRSVRNGHNPSDSSRGCRNELCSTNQDLATYTLHCGMYAASPVVKYRRHSSRRAFAHQTFSRTLRGSSYIIYSYQQFKPMLCPGL